MQPVLRIAALTLAALALAGAPDNAAARRGGGGHHHFHHRAIFVGGFWYGPYWYGYYPPPYYYGPDYSQPQYQPPAVYVEKFEGTPSAETPGEFYCPAAGSYYPEVSDCPHGGWQRLFRAGSGNPSASAAPAPAPPR